MDPYDEKTGKAIDLLNSVLAGYRDLAYKIIIAHAGLMVAISYSAATAESDSTATAFTSLTNNFLSSSLSAIYFSWLTVTTTSKS